MVSASGRKLNLLAGVTLICRSCAETDEGCKRLCLLHANCAVFNNCTIPCRKLVDARFDEFS